MPRLLVNSKGHVLGRRNALGDRMDEYEEKVHAAAVPQAAARPTSITANRLGGHTNQSNNNLLSNSSSIGNGKIVRKWRLASTEQAADFKVPNSRLDFTDLFNGSVDEAMKAIEAGIHFIHIRAHVVFPVFIVVLFACMFGTRCLAYFSLSIKARFKFRRKGFTYVPEV